MKKVGFFLSPTKKWIGGINYYKNLFLAINGIEDSRFKFIVFLPKNVDQDIVDTLFAGCNNIELIYTSMLQEFHLYWFFWKFIRKVIRSDLAVLPLCIYYGIRIISHSDFANIPMVKVINWIPDFQYTHFPEMFNPKQVRFINSYHSIYINSADMVVVSSKNVADDLIALYPKMQDKTFILPFVSQVPDFYWDLDEENWRMIANQYHLDKYFFYIPNQFYKHKNHKILIDAMQCLITRGIQVQMVCSGDTEDPRNLDFFAELREYINQKNCADYFKIIGIIPYDEVFSLIRFSLAVINPSRFEGWSSTVEECKSAGKRILLSDIAVHHEQIPTAFFFGVDDPIALANYLEMIWIGRHTQDGTGIINMTEVNKFRTLNYGLEYLKLLTLV